MNIKVRVNGQNAIWYDKPPRVADNSIQFVKFYFDLSEDWDGCTVSAQFTQGENTYNRLLVENLCSLPEELVAGKCQVSLFGYRHGEVYRATIIPLDFNVYHSGFVPSVNTPVPPTPDLYAQLLEQLYEVAILARYYIISAEQISEEYVQFSFTPSQQGMPEVPSKTIKLYRGPEGPEGSHVVGIERGETVVNITTFIIKMSDGKQFPFEVATEKGDPGYTPIKGTDYYTAEEEKAFFDRILELVNPILQQANQAISDANDKANLANQAAADAITATQSASDAAVNANNSAQTANNAASDANKAASRADTAASGAVASTQEAVNAADAASQAANYAVGAANSASQAASEANTAANAANEKASTADTAASAASTAASNANTAASNADKAATAANQAANLANTAAGSATSAASEANTAATGANQAKNSAETAAQTANTAAAAAQKVVDSIVPDVSKLKDDLGDLDEILNVKHLRVASVATTGSYVRAIAFSGLSLIGGHGYTFTVKPVSITTNEYYLYFVDSNGTETTINDRTDRITYNFTPTEDMNNVSIKVSSGASEEQTFECSWIENVGDNEIDKVNTRIDNLFDGTGLVELSILNGHFVTSLSGYEGIITGDSSSCATSFIPVRPNDKLRVDNVYLETNRSICAYDEERNFVEVIAKGNSKVTSYTFTVPDNCYYIRATGKTGVAPTVTFLSIPNNLDSLRVENPIATITNGYYITRYSGLEGVVDNSSDSAITDYIPVKPNSVINIDGIYNEGNRCTCCYDKNKNFVSVISSSLTRTNFSKNIKIPSNARYIRITSRKDVVPTIKYVNTIIDGTNVSNPYVNGKELFDGSTIKPVLTFIDDDTWGIQYVTRQKELCDRLGIKCSFACLTEQVEKNEGLLELLLSYELDGFPIIFHANQQIKEYDTSTLDVVAEERDFVTGLQKMHKFGFSDYKIWCTPFGTSREDQKKLAYKWGFDGLVTSGYANAYNNPYEYSSRFAIKRNNLGSNTDTTASDIVDDVANIKIAIDNASECNGWVCISTHSAYNLYKNGEADDAMEEIVNYALSKGFEIRTVNEELRRRMPIYRYYEQF